MARKSLSEILNGQTRFGRLEVVREAEGVPNPGNGTTRRVECRCDCGDVGIYYLGNVKRGKSQSCGCLAKEVLRALRTTHGHSMQRSTQTISPEYRVWAHIKGRCLNPEDSSFHNYGGRGIQVCQRWADSFEAFYEDMGPRPSSSHEIDRGDNDGHYEPGNCRWVTVKENMRNTRVNRWVFYRGERLCLLDAAAKAGIERRTVSKRLDMGWSDEDALTTPVGCKRA